MNMNAGASLQLAPETADWSSPRDPAEILRRVDALLPLVEEDAKEIEKIQHLTPRIREAFMHAGVFSLGFPVEGWGGPQMPMDDQIRLVEKVAYHSPSAAWNIQILVDGGFWAPRMNEQAAREIFKSLDSPVAGSTRPAGKAVRVESGYKLSGRFSFGSGIRDAEAIYGGFYVYNDDGTIVEDHGRPKLFQFFLPKDQVTLHDTWYTTGLAGSGSVDYSVEDVFVPAHWEIEPFADEGLPERPPLTRYPALILMNVVGVPLGIAKRAIDEYRKIIEKPARGNAFASMKTKDPYVPAAFAEATALYQAARVYALSSSNELCTELFAGRPLSPEQQAKITQVCVLTGTLCRQALEILMESLGSRSVLASTPFDSLYRDMSTAARHQVFRDKTWEMAGLAALELPWPEHLTE